MVTDPQTNIHKPTDRTDYKYTAPQLASAQCNYSVNHAKFVCVSHSKPSTALSRLLVAANVNYMLQYLCCCSRIFCLLFGIAVINYAIGLFQVNSVKLTSFHYTLCCHLLAFVWHYCE